MKARPGPEFGRLEDAVRSVVVAHPSPPRPCDRRVLLRISYGSTAGKSIVGVAVFLGLPLTAIELWAMASDPGHGLIAIVAAAFTAFLLITPALPARRAAKALQIGLLTTAEVLEVQLRPRGDPLTIDSISHGFAGGRWRVRGPLGAFEEAFETDASWALTVDVGKQVPVLVDPDRAKVFVPIGPPA
jgi:hypothetical protein